MPLWYRIANNTEYDILYFESDTTQKLFPVLKNEFSKYIFSDDNLITLNIYDKRGHNIKTLRFSAKENRLNTYLLSVDDFS